MNDRNLQSPAVRLTRRIRPSSRRARFGLSVWPSMSGSPMPAASRSLANFASMRAARSQIAMWPRTRFSV